MSQIIGIGHYSRTGKDSFANFFLDHYAALSPEKKAIKRSLAWKLKQICHDLYAWAGVMPPEHYETVEGAKDRDIVLPGIGLTPVQLWVAFGTDAVRNNVYDRTWLDYLLKTDHHCDILLIPDVRFPNEAEAIKAAGGILVKVVRPDYGPRKTVADRALLNYAGWDYVIGKSGKMDELRDWALVFALHMNIDGRPKPMSREEKEAALAVETIEL